MKPHTLPLPEEDLEHLLSDAAPQCNIDLGNTFEPYEFSSEREMIKEEDNIILYEYQFWLYKMKNQHKQLKKDVERNRLTRYYGPIFEEDAGDISEIPKSRIEKTFKKINKSLKIMNIDIHKKNKPKSFIAGQKLGHLLEVGNALKYGNYIII